MPLTLLVRPDVRVIRAGLAPQRKRRPRQRSLWRAGAEVRARGLRIARRHAVLAASVRSSTVASVRAQVREEVETLGAEVARLRDAARQGEAALRERIQRLEEELRVARVEHAGVAARLEEQRTVEFDLRRSLIAVGVSAEQQTRAIQQELEQARAMNQALMQVLERRLSDAPRREASGLAVLPASPAAECPPRPWYRRLWPWGASAPTTAARK